MLVEPKSAFALRRLGVTKLAMRDAKVSVQAYAHDGTFMLLRSRADFLLRRSTVSCAMVALDLRIDARPGHVRM